MNGRYSPLPTYPSLGEYILIETTTFENLSASSGDGVEQTKSVDKKTGYRLIGIAGYNCKASASSGSNPDRASFFRVTYTEGDTTQGATADTILIGFRANAALKVDVDVYLIYFKIT